MTAPAPVTDLISRSNLLGADPRTTNFGGGNTSAKGVVLDPASGKEVELVWVKGSGGDLATLRPEGLAVLRRDRVLALKDVYRGIEHEDEMVGLFAYTVHGAPQAAPSIDTSMHALVEAAHVDHLHPDAGIAIANSADGPELTRRIYGDQVLWVPWRRPGFQLGLDIAALKDQHPDAVGAILGGHGITAWGATSEECQRNSMWIIAAAENYIAAHGRPEPFGEMIETRAPLGATERRARAAALLPTIRGLVSTDERVLGHVIDTPEVLDFLARTEAGRLAALGTSCPDHYLRTKASPLFLDIENDVPVDEALAEFRRAHERYRDEYRAYYERNAEPDSPPIRGADPRIVLVPGVGLLSFGPDKHTARVAGEYFVNSINAMRGAEALSRYTPIPEREKFRIEYWALEEAKLRRAPAPKALAGRVAVIIGADSEMGRATAERLANEGACVVIADVDTEKASATAGVIGSTDVAIGVAVDVTDKLEISALISRAVLAFGGIDLVVNNAGPSVLRTLFETTVDEWDPLHDVMGLGSFLAACEAAKVMIAQELGGDIIYIGSQDAGVAGPTDVACSFAKANQAHHVNLLAAELGEFGIRVNGINPSPIAPDSERSATERRTHPAASSGAPATKLNRPFARRTLIGNDAQMGDIANAIVALCGGELDKTTGLIIPVGSCRASAHRR